MLGKFILIGALLLGGCQVKTDPTPAELRAELVDDLRASEGSPDETKIDELLALSPPVHERVWALGHKVELRRTANDLTAIPKPLTELGTALTELATAQITDEDFKWSREAAERAMRQLHVDVYERWMGSGNDLTVNILTLNGKLYREHFPDAIEGTEVMWRDAEMLRQTGQPMEAVPIYHMVIQKDFLGKYEDQARDRIIDAWTAASFNTPKPTGLKQAIPLPSPHKEWLEIVTPVIDKDRSAEKAREYLFRIAQLELDYLNYEQGEAMLMDLAFSKEDKVAVEAAKVLLLHAADTYRRKYDFRKLRKTLQENKYLWKQSDFRSLYFELKEKVEGRK